MHRMRSTISLGICSLIFAPLIASAAWAGPTAAPPDGNVAAPINVGATAQVKNGSIGVNGLAVFGNSLFGGSAGSNAYLNFGATGGSAGYGIRDNAGTLEFKDNSGSWESIQATVQHLTGFGGNSTSTITHGLNVTGGCVAVNGTCLGTGSGSSPNSTYQLVTAYGSPSTWANAYCPAGKKATGGSCTGEYGYSHATFMAENYYACACWDYDRNWCGGYITVKAACI